MVESLIWGAAIFAAGSFLVLERRCLGQRALVQPLSLCLIVGWYTNNVETGLWLGICLQLLSLAPSRIIDWALVSVVAAIALLVTAEMGIFLRVGDAETSMLLLVTVLCGQGAKYIERNYAKRDREKVAVHPPWRDMDPARAVERSVYRAIHRWILIGGLEVLVSLGVTIAAIKAIMLFGETPTWLTQSVAIGVPTLGMASLLSSLTGARFLIWAGLSSGLGLVLFQGGLS